MAGFLSLFAACRSLAAVASEEKVTLTLPAMRVEKILPILSEAAHIKLSATPQTIADIVALRFHDVPVSEALNRIAGVVDGTWKAESGGFKLVRTPDVVRAEQSRELGQTEELFRKEIAGTLDSLNGLPEWSPDLADALAENAEKLSRNAHRGSIDPKTSMEAFRLSQQTPMGRLVKLLAGFISPRELANLPLFTKVVWAANPTSVQRPLSNEAEQQIGQCIRDQLMWNDVADRHALRDWTNPLLGHWSGGIYNSPDRRQPGVARVLLSAIRTAPGASVVLTLTSYDAAGAVMGRSQSSLGESYDAAFKSVEEPGSDPLIGFGKEAVMLANLYANPVQGLQTLPRDLIARMTDPENFDPLSFLVSPALNQAAELENVDMVACLPDSSISAATMGNAQDVRLSGFIGRLAYAQTDLVVKGGWMTVKPTRPSEARSYRADRRELGKYLQRLSTGVPLSLDEQADYAFRLPDRRLNPIPKWLASVLHFSLPTDNRDDCLRFYGSLSARQKSELAESGIQLSRLTAPQLDLVSALVFGSQPDLRFIVPNDQLAKNRALTNAVTMFNNGLLAEPTELLPDGIPQEGSMTAQAVVKQVVASEWNDGSLRPAQLLSPYDLAWNQFAQERADIFPWMAQASRRLDLKHLTIGGKEIMRFDIQFTPFVSMPFSFEGRDGGKFHLASRGNLPEDFEQEVSRCYGELKKEYSNFKANQASVKKQGILPP